MRPFFILCIHFLFYASIFHFMCPFSGTVLGIEALKERVDRSSLPSQKVATSRMGVKNVGHAPQKDNEPFSALKEGEEGHWEVGGACVT